MCASSSLDHIFFAPWVETGMHMTSIKRPEIEMAALRRADRIVIHNNDEKPIHVMTRDLEHAEKAKDHGWNSVGDLDFAKLPTLPELIVGRAAGPAVGPRDHLFPEQYRARLPVRRGRRRGHQQGQGRRLRPRIADRLVHRRRAPVARDRGRCGSACSLELLRRGGARDAPASPRRACGSPRAAAPDLLPTGPRRSRACSWRPASR